MPYINPVNRPRLDAHIRELNQLLNLNQPGDINYAISKLVWSLFDDHQSYTSANTLLGVLEAVKAEFYRRQVIPLEEQKIISNGDL